jgi:fatty-acyl-CoA synthase
VRWDCTLFQYVGELCRYLLNAPPCPAEQHHRIRLCCGNGLRPDIWPAFKARFRLPRIFEFYAATESNVALFNLDGCEGAVGRIPGWAKHRFPVKIVKLDEDNEVPLRGPDRLCIECAPGEVGEVLGEVLNDPSKPAARFEGYADRAATERRILRDVARKGDAWFRSGDLMRRDRLGYFYFVDRIGDTFRWKGENVATTQVAEALSAAPGVKEANVYGVKVPGTEGRAGMAALVVDKAFDFATLHEVMGEALPEFARPLFVRLRPFIEVTGTFKPRKQDLAREGFDPAATTDALWFNNPVTRSFEPIDAELYQRICAGDFRL